MRLAVISYRCLQILMVSTLWMDRATAGLVIIGLVAAGEVYHHWYAWDRQRQLQWSEAQARQDERIAIVHATRLLRLPAQEHPKRARQVGD